MEREYLCFYALIVVTTAGWVMCMCQLHEKISLILTLHQLLCFKKHGPFKTSLIKTEKEFIMHVFLN